MNHHFMHSGLAEPRTKEEWREYIAAHAPLCPDLPTWAAYKRLAGDDLDDLMDARIDYHSALVLVRTEQMKRIHSQIRRRMLTNRQQPAGARRGIVLDGSATLGKSTLAKIFAADFERSVRRRHPERFRDGYTVEGYLVDYTPVVYLNIPSQATPKDLSRQLADYLALPHRAATTKNDLTAQVLKAMRLCGTELVIIDDVHFLELSMKEGKVVNDHLKYLANHTAATFLYTGTDLDHSGLFLEGRAATRATQTAGRNTLIQMKPFAVKTEAQQREWASVIMAMEEALRLYRHKPGSLVKLWRYLHARTAGTMCGLHDLIRESAIEAIQTGEETITRKLMDRIEISKFAETSYKAAQRPSAGKASVPSAA